MGRYNLAPSKVYQTVTKVLEASQHNPRSKTLQPPPWYKTVGAIPPSEILTRPQPVRVNDRPRNKRTKKPSKLFKPQPLIYEEDELRKEFYTDHPWELARPRVVLEEDGKDEQKGDWSKIQQPYKQLDGESVVQRQLWLLHNEAGMSRESAYSIARQEFYAIRHEEDVERMVAKEEALSTGAYFGKSILEVGMELEDKAYDSWKDWAIKEIEAIEQQKQARITGTIMESAPVATEDLGEPESPSSVANNQEMEAPSHAQY